MRRQLTVLPSSDQLVQLIENQIIKKINRIMISNMN